MQLRDYQLAAISSIFKYFEDGGTGNPLIAMPTGTGKAPILSGFIRDAYLAYPNQRIMMVTHVKELIEQNFKWLLRLWPTAPAGVYSAGMGRRESQFPITFAGIASVVNCPEAFGKVDLILIDEAHLVSPKSDTMYQKFILALRAVNKHLKVIGLTATHYRLGQGLLTEEDGLFTDICFNMTEMESFNWFIEQGYLVPPVPKRTRAELNTEGVAVHAGEFVQRELQAAVDREEVTAATLRETLEVSAGRNHWLVFASGVEHAEHTRDMMESMGVSTAIVHSKMSDGKRDAAIRDFREGRVRAICNNGVLTTGFDYPEIDLIVMLRPTKSPGLWVQMLGRGTRPVYAEGYDLHTQEGRLAAIAASPKKNTLVLDFAGNTMRLGPINDPHLPGRKIKGNGIAPVKVCENCGTYNHASVRICICCGAEFPRQVKIQTGASTEALIARGAAETPVFEVFDVDRVVYREHKKKERPPSIKVSYYCGFKLIEQWICLEHVGWARSKARGWWRQHQTQPLRVGLGVGKRAGVLLEPPPLPVPETTREGLLRIKELATPRRIRVQTNTERPEVIGYEW